MEKIVVVTGANSGIGKSAAFQFAAHGYRVYTGVTGKLLNHRGEIVKRADSSMSFFKIITSTHVYPPYVEEEETAKRVWKVCNEFQ